MGLQININPGLYRQRIPCVLDGDSYLLTFFYVRRASGWFFHLDTSEGTRVLSGVRLVTGVDLLKSYHSRPGVPPGPLVVLGSLIPPRDPTRDEMGDLFQLYYWDAS